MNAIETLRQRVEQIKRAGEIERVDRVVDALAAQALGTSQILVDHLIIEPSSEKTTLELPESKLQGDE